MDLPDFRNMALTPTHTAGRLKLSTLRLSFAKRTQLGASAAVDGQVHVQGCGWCNGHI